MQRGLLVDVGAGWQEGVPTHAEPAGEPAGEPVALEWPPEQRPGIVWVLLLTPWILGPLAAVVLVAATDIDARVGSGDWLLLAGVGIALFSTLLAAIMLLRGFTSRIRDRVSPDRVAGIVVLRATARPRGGDGGAEQESHYLAVDDGSRPVLVYRSTSWLNGKVRTGDRVRLSVGPRRRQVLRVHPAE